MDLLLLIAIAIAGVYGMLDFFVRRWRAIQRSKRRER